MNENTCYPGRPVQIIDIENSIPLTMQLSVWDPKLGPVTAMLVGGADQLALITPDQQEDTTRMMDMLAVGATCDLSKDGVNRQMLKFAITDLNTRGGESWFLLATYFMPTVDVSKAIFEDFIEEFVKELVKEIAETLRHASGMAAEAMAIRHAYNPARSRWRELLHEMRLSIWSLMQKAVELLGMEASGALAFS
jgi:hypothetical protein